MKKIKFTIDNKECTATRGQTIMRAAKENNIFIPGLCDFVEVSPVGSCRICTVKVNGQFTTACTTKVKEGMHVENDTPELQDSRKAIIEMLYVEGNHQCAICEKSGDCDLQALAYKYQILVPRFPYQFTYKEIEAPHPLILIDPNRCIQCMRCLRAVKTPNGKPVFRAKRINKFLKITINPNILNMITEEIAMEATRICPVGAILGRGSGYQTPIGQHKYDRVPIGKNLEDDKQE